MTLTTYLNDAKVRGAFTTILSGGSSAALNFASINAGMSPILSTILTFYVFGSIVAYSVDILFAKNEFQKNSFGKYIKVPYSDLGFRFTWLFKSFFSRTFFKFLITMIIDTLIGIALLTAILKALDARNIEFMFKDTLVAGLVAFGTFVLYNNVLRFDWAYKEDSNPTLDIVVLMWCSLTILLFSLLHTGKNKNNEEENIIEEETESSTDIVPKPVRMTWLYGGDVK